jgi:FAD/FMN-containing dehydrogenase/Fe-S oxidoreductase
LELALKELSKQLKGDLHDDALMRRLYATDASVYRSLPLAVALPKTAEDLVTLVKFANKHKVGLISRTAGTSLAGQCVGEGIVVDFSKYFTEILDFNQAQRTVTVQPGVVRDQLNNYLRPFGLFFGPNTSTSNRCMIGGMVGNNSSGTTSIKYGVTRDKLIGMTLVLSDGSQIEVRGLNKTNFQRKKALKTLEGSVYRHIDKELAPSTVQQRIIKEFPKPEIHRRNTGYALDALIKSNIFSGEEAPLNLSNLICGSEGTLAFITEITLSLDPLPPKFEAMLALHYQSIDDCLQSVSTLMQHDLYSCEMMDDSILNLTKHNKLQQENRSFIQGNPKAILMCELRDDTEIALEERISEFNKTIESLGLSYAHPVLYGEDIRKASDLRKAGLGLLGNMIGDKKAVACIEDTAVALEDLSAYISEFSHLMEGYKQNAVYYAHAGAGELHLRPVLNLKDQDDRILFRKITTDVARLVKKYRGSMSGEHGDGIVRSEFIPMMIGKDNYDILKRIKQVFDPNNIFNPGKIVDAHPMDEHFRYEVRKDEPEVSTLMDFSASKGILREAEKCNGSGDCRKLPEFGGTMCPSYRATRNEKDTTRARANALREYLSHSEKANKFNHEELHEVFDLCLSCKACSRECPSSVDVASLKAEFQYQYQKENGRSLKTKAFAYNNSINEALRPLAPVVNWAFKNALTSYFIKKSLGIATKRSLPLINSKSLYQYLEANSQQLSRSASFKTVYLYVDEFTNALDTEIGKDAVDLLTALGYSIKVIKAEESGRAMISKGLLDKAKNLANKNVALFSNVISKSTPLIGIEPSAIFTFKDEYLRLADDQKAAKSIAKHTYLIEEFLQSEIQKGNITSEQFTKQALQIKFHGHCYQKALGNQKASFDVLNLPVNYKVTIIPSGCCGMAGSFGYEKDKYDISITIAGHTLFPAIRKASETTVIAANGTSCRHQIFDGTGKKALHPVSILKDALI